MKKNKGITLIVLIITIIIMLILVAVVIDITIDNKLIDNAKSAVDQTNEKVGQVQTRVDELMEEMDKIESGSKGVNFEKLFNEYKNIEEAVGIAEDGSIVDLSLWDYYDCLDEDNEYAYGIEELYDGPCWSLGEGDTGSWHVRGYVGSFENGKIIGKVPMYIKDEGDSNFYPVKAMIYTFLSYDEELVESPEIPSSVIIMDATFGGCTSLTTAPTIPNGVTDMYDTFRGCTNLTGTLTINANPTSYESCLSNCATNPGCHLVLNGSSTVLDSILATANGNPNITIGN